MDQRPLIGIPCRHDISPTYSNRPVNAQSESYLKAITEAGGIPMLIPLDLDDEALRRLYDLSTGILLTGGGDIDPDLYQEETKAKLSDVQYDRDELETKLTRWAAEEGKPILGICRGIQVMAVAAGGSLWQHLPEQLPNATLHQYEYNTGDADVYTQLIHAVELTPGCLLSQMVQDTTVKVNSLHHQAVREVPEPYKVVGRSSDGVVEVIEREGHPFFCGVQWHPEVLIEEREDARAIFDGFIRACQARMTDFEEE